MNLQLNDKIYKAFSESLIFVVFRHRFRDARGVVFRPPRCLLEKKKSCQYSVKNAHYHTSPN